MVSPAGRASTFQEQLALELIAARTAQLARGLFLDSGKVDEAGAKRLADKYSMLVVGGVLTAAAIRTGYLQRFASENNQRPFVIPQGVLQPSVEDALVPGLRPEGAVYAALRHLDKFLEDQSFLGDPVESAARILGEYAESTVTAAPDWVDDQVLGPDRRVVALRRVTHPSACDRCVAVADVLVFKSNPRLRHEACRCSFEPVFFDDPAYRRRLAKYEENAAKLPGSPHVYRDGTRSEFGMSARFARDVRARGRRQLADARFREQSVFYEEQWGRVLRDEQQRLSSLVKAVPSTTYRNWAVMTSANIADKGSGLLPVLSRKGV